MKRFFISSILIATLTIASVFIPDLDMNNAANGVTASVTTATAKAAAVNPLKSAIPKVKATVRTATTVTLKAGNVSKAGGYQIYRAASSNGSYKYIGKTSNSSYVDKGLSSVKSYYYKAKAYKTVSGVKYYSKTSAAAGVTPTLKKAAYIAAQSSTSGTAAVAWSAVSGAGGYYVYRASSADGTYKYVGSSTCTSYTDKSVSGGKTYYYKVRAVKSSKGVKYYGVYSGKASVTVKSSGSTITPTPTPTATPTPTTGGSNKDTNTYDSSYASQVLKIVNKERAKAGVSALTMSQELVAPANKRAKEIKESFSHTRPNGTEWSTVLSEYNVSVGAAGENIAYGFNTPEEVMDKWMGSTGHRANILNASYRHIGIGVYEVNGTVYCSQLFSD
ncbi:CAP domain-containing protein [Anaerocolumna xylanovorans]|uniref:Uncharacterized conserved protein YkwD, contains CAP (CSP/antigen 5/PR1) domain n=1 Tax=Anaerocolumna xylanovorans DSM 12503 TaxID=1121345 RepID=A0A1M7YN21_9FIRM|nr:CAP domain-containing protein [Anaerocolumna xylanovorans]SHO54043.1 Uncharacterized conserved protein YkwD, contains CAP (CSP/antigen 5/PR1) domain [Anaerocolumna xylanovorans DSM 12503]